MQRIVAAGSLDRPGCLPGAEWFAIRLLAEARFVAEGLAGSGPAATRRRPG